MKTDNKNVGANGEIKVSMTKMKARKKQKRRITIFAICLSSLALVLCFVLIAIFFRIEAINVKGNEKYSTEEILKTCAIEKGSGIFTIDKGKTEDNLKKAFPAIKEVKIGKKLPSTVEITVRESKEIFYLAFGEHYYSLDDSLKVIEKYESAEEANLYGLKRIYISDISECITGRPLKTKDGDIPEMIQTLYKNLVERNLFVEIGEIDFRDKFNIIFTLGVKYTVKFGSTLECATKLEILDGILEKVGNDYIGTIDLSSGNIKEVTMARD